jgi:hypothetical protein
MKPAVPKVRRKSHNDIINSVSTTRTLKEKDADDINSQIAKITQAIEARKNGHLSPIKKSAAEGETDGSEEVPNDDGDDGSNAEGNEGDREEAQTQDQQPVDFKSEVRRVFNGQVLSDEDLTHAAICIENLGESAVGTLLKNLELIREKRKKEKRERDLAERAARERTKAVKFNIEKGVGDKLKFTLQDPRNFALDTTYRKRDKYSDQPGVSLLVGNKETTKCEEVIAILFDDDRFDEETAAEWWDRNEIRFVGLDGVIRASTFDSLAKQVAGLKF